MKQIPVTKNQRVTVEISDLTHEGLGVGKIDHYPLFIENALPKEKIDVLVVKTGKQYGYGKVMEILEESADRVPLKHENLLRTGIAPLQHMTYDAQLRFKKNVVVNALNKIGKLPDVPVADTTGMEKPFGYRNKAQIPVRRVNGELETGFFRKNSHDLIPIEDYYIQSPKIDAAIIAVRDIMRRFSVKPYDEVAHTGFLRHIIIREGHYSKELMVVLVTRVEKFFKSDLICKEIVKALPEVVSIVQNINDGRNNVIMGKEDKVLYGGGTMKDSLLEKTYEISPQSFYQVNTLQAEAMYKKAIELAELKKSDVVIDAYCGIGTIALSLADQVKHVYGVEVLEAAVNDADRNRVINGIENATFIAEKAEKLIEKWAKQGMKADVIVVDPPRKGLAPSFVTSVLEMMPDRLVYVSCNPATLARDCQLLSEGGYEVQEVYPFDMFPQTYHIESVAVLVRGE